MKTLYDTGNNMKTLSEFASTHTRLTKFHKVTDLSETLNEIDLIYLIDELQTIQANEPNRDLVLRTDTDIDSMFVTVTVGYYDLESIEEFNARVKQAYDTYVYCETMRLHRNMPPTERKALEIKALEEKLALLKGELNEND